MIESINRLDRLEEDAEQRTFELNNDSLNESVINSTELRYTHMEMDLVTALGPVPRMSSRTSTRAQSHQRVTNKKYILPVEIEQHILQTCY